MLNTDKQTAIVMTVNAKENEYKKHQLTDDDEVHLLDNFRDENHVLQFLIVTNKLLTGFDAPILQVMYLDKTIKEHNLLQAICRTNRLFPNKTYGLIVDYIGVFSNIAKAFDFDEKSIQDSAKNIHEVASALPLYLEKCLAYFEGIDRSKEGYDLLILAQQKLKEVEMRDSFAQDYNLLSKSWEIISPSPLLNQYEKEYIFVSEIYNSVRPINNSGKLLWHAFGEKTKMLIDKHIIKGELHTDIETIIMNAELIEELQANPTSPKAKEFEIKLFTRVRKHTANPKFAELSHELEQLKHRAETNQITSLEFLKGIIDGSQRLIFLEKRELNQNPRNEKTAVNALTELFKDAKSENTPIIVENIVKDIDSEIVKYVRVEGWKYNASAEKDVRKCLLEILKKYKLHKEVELYKKAYKYIEEYY